MPVVGIEREKQERNMKQEEYRWIDIAQEVFWCCGNKGYVRGRDVKEKQASGNVGNDAYY